MTDFSEKKIIFVDLGIEDYSSVWQKMKVFTETRTKETNNEIWFLQHPPVFTLGQQGERNQILTRTDVPIIQTDRGGHVTYHGPGQLIVYPLLNLKQYSLGPRTYVTLLESIIIEVLNQFNIDAYARTDAPGVYVEGKKIASLGLRIRKGCSYHGIAMNVSMDLTPFNHINPCGLAGIQMTQIQDFIPDIQLNEVSEVLKKKFYRFVISSHRSSTEGAS